MRITASPLALLFAGLSLALAGCGGTAAPSTSASAPSASVAASAVPASSKPAASSGGATSALAKPAASSLASAGASAVAAPAPLNPPVNIKVSVYGVEAEAGLYLADQRGYFKEEGLNVEFVPVNQSSDQTAALLSGSVQFSTGAITAAQFNATGRGVAIKLVGSQAEFQPPDEANAAFVVRQDLLDSGRYKDAKDMKGLTIASTGSGSVSDMYLERIANTAGLQLSDFKTTVIPVPDVPASLGNKAIDAAWTFEPFITIAKLRNFGKVAVPVGKILQGRANPAVLTASASFISQQPEAVKRFITAHLRGQRDYYDAVEAGKADKAPVLQLLTTRTPIKDVSMFNAMYMHHVDPNGAIDEKELGLEQDYFLKVGVQKEKVDLSQFIDRSYTDYALQRLGKR